MILSALLLMSITIKAQIITKQKCYLSTEVDGKMQYLSRGEEYGLRSIMDDYGVAVELDVPNTANPNQVSVKYTDSDLYMYDANNLNVFSDGGAFTWTFIAVEGGYQIRLNNFTNAFVSPNAQGQVKIHDEKGQTPAVWKLVTDTEHDANVALLAPAHKAAMLTAAGYSEEDLAKYTTLKEVSTPVEGNGQHFEANNASQTLTLLNQDYTNLEAGLYKVSVQAFQRTRNYTDMLPDVTEGFDDPTAFLIANNESVRLKSIFTDAQIEQVNSEDVNYTVDETTYYIPNTENSGAAYFSKGLYNNEVYVNVDSDGALNVKIYTPQRTNGTAMWYYFNNYIKVEKIEEKTLTLDGGH